MTGVAGLSDLDVVLNGEGQVHVGNLAGGDDGRHEDNGGHLIIVPAGGGNGLVGGHGGRVLVVGGCGGQDEELLLEAGRSIAEWLSGRQGGLVHIGRVTLDRPGGILLNIIARHFFSFGVESEDMTGAEDMTGEGSGT